MTSRSVIGFLFVIWQYGEANVVEEYDNGLLTILATHTATLPSVFVIRPSLCYVCAVCVHAWKSLYEFSARHPVIIKTHPVRLSHTRPPPI